MNKKKIIAIISVSVVIALLLAGVLAYPILFKEKEVIAKAENSYDAEYISHCTYAHDEHIKIDGVLDEKEWQGKKWFSNTFLANLEGKLPVMKVTGFTTKYGVYIASTVTDSNLVNNGQHSKQNSLWEFYVAACKDGEKLPDDGLYRYPFLIDMEERSYDNFNNFERAVVVDGELNSGKTEGATLEMFIPWQVMGIDPEEFIPSKFHLMPSYRAMLEGRSTTMNMDPPTRYLDKLNDYYIFDANGYTTADREGAVVGDTKFGYTKMANWDISKEAEGIVRSSVGTTYHKIFFSQEYGNNFILEATIVPMSTLDGDPKAGLYFLGADGLYYSVFMDFNENLLVDSVNGTKNVSQYQLITLHNQNDSWSMNSLSEYAIKNPNATKKEGVRLTVVKYGGQFWYFADGNFITCEEHIFLDMDMIPGFYTMGSDALYKDYSCTTIKDVDELKDYLNKQGLYYIDAKVGSAGGSVTSSTPTVKKGGSYDITIVTKPGYEVSSIDVNGVEKIKDAKKKAVEGTYTITGANKNQVVTVKFKKCKGQIFSGTVKDETGPIGAKITLFGQTNGLLRYEFDAQGKNGFTAEIPAGTYRILVTADYHQEYEGTVKIKGNTKKDYTLKLSEFPATVNVNGKSVASALDKWDLSKQGQGKVSTSYKAGGKMAGLYFSKTGSDFVMQATINYTTNFVEGAAYQPDLMGGFVFSDGQSNGWILARDTGVVTTGFVFENGIVDYNMLRYPTKNGVDFAVAKKGDVLNFYVDGEFIGTRKWAEIAPNIDPKSELALGFYMVADKTADIEFSNYSVQVGTAAATKFMNSRVAKEEYIPGSKLFAKNVKVNGTLLKSMTKRWDISEIAKNKVSGSYELGTRYSPLYLMKHGKTMMVQTRIEYTTDIKSGVDYQPDMFGGFVFNDGKNEGFIWANRTGVAYTGWKFEQGLYKNPVLALPDQRPVTMTAAVQDGYIYIFFDDVYILRKKVTQIVPGAKANADLAIGLYMMTDKASDLSFTKTTVTTDAKAVKKYISTNRYNKTPTISAEDALAIKPNNGEWFKGASDRWMVTGTFKRTDDVYSDAWCPGFNIMVDGTELTLSAVSQGIVFNQFADTRYAYHAISGITEYNKNPDISKFVVIPNKDNGVARQKDVMHFKAVILKDMFYVWFGFEGEPMVLSWVVPLNETLYATDGETPILDGFKTGSKYNLGIHVMNSKGTGKYENLVIKSGSQVSDSVLPKLMVAENMNVVVDEDAGTIKTVPNQISRSRFVGSSTTWEVTGKFVRNDAVVAEAWCPGFAIKVGGKELTLSAVTQGLLFNQYGSNRYPWHAMSGVTEYNLDTSISKFISKPRTESVVNFKAVIANDIFYVWFGFEGEEMELSWKVPLAQDLYGVAGKDHDGDGVDDAKDVIYEAFTEGSRYSLGFITMTTSGVGQYEISSVKKGSAVDLSFLDKLN